MTTRSSCAITALSILATCTLAASAEPGAPTVSGELGRELDRYLERLEGVGFSGTVLVAKDGTVVLEKGYGPADRESGRPVTNETIYSIGSITKQFTAAAIMKLVTDGKLDVDDTIGKFFDDVPEDKSGITVHQLLTHTAGFVGMLGDDFDPMGTKERVLQLAMRSQLQSAPGTEYQYTNVGYSLLGMIVEEVSGQPYEVFLAEQLFEPAGMMRTGYVLPGYDDGELAVGYRDATRWGTVLGRTMLADGPCWHLRANGGIHSTPRDMYRWHQVLEGDKVLSADARRQIFSPHADEGGGRSYYGYGWAIFDTPWGSKLIAHNGGNGIFSADFRRYVDDGFVIFGATSHSRFAPFDLVSDVLADIVMGREYELPPATTTFDDGFADVVAGEYEVRGGGRLVVENGGDRLILRAADADAERTLGGQLDPDDPRVRILGDRSVQALAGWMHGDLAPFLESWGGQMSEEELRGASRRVRSMREDRLGAFRAARLVSMRARGPVVEVTVMMEHEQGAAPMQLVWRDERIVGLMLGGDGEDTGAPHLFPIDDVSFTAFDLRTPERRMTARFDVDAAGVRGVTLDIDGQTIEATRTRMP